MSLHPPPGPIADRRWVTLATRINAGEFFRFMPFGQLKTLPPLAASFSAIAASVASTDFVRRRVKYDKKTRRKL